MIDIINRYALELKASNDLFLDRSYAKIDDGQIVVWLSFHTQELADINLTRRIMVDIVEGYIKRMNANAVLVQLNEGYPFDPSNFYINIDFSSFFGQFVDPLYVGRAELTGDEFNTFYANTALNKWAELRHNFHMHSEPYWVTKQIVMIEVNAKKEKIKQHIEEIKEAAGRRRLNDRTGTGQP